MVDEVARWRIAYDTVSALVAADSSHVGVPEPLPAAQSPAGGGACRGSDGTDVIQHPQQQQRRLSQSTLSAVSGRAPADCRRDDAGHGRQVRAGGDAPGGEPADGRLVALYRRLTDAFFAEATLWLYTGVLLSSSAAARRTRGRLAWLGAATGRGVEAAAANVLAGFVAGYRTSRQRLLGVDVERALSSAGGGVGAGRVPAELLSRLSVDLGVVLNARQMMRAFAAVVRDLVDRTAASQPGASTAAAPLIARTGPPTSSPPHGASPAAAPPIARTASSSLAAVTSSHASRPRPRYSPSHVLLAHPGWI